MSALLETWQTVIKHLNLTLMYKFRKCPLFMYTYKRPFISFKLYYLQVQFFTSKHCAPFFLHIHLIYEFTYFILSENIHVQLFIV